MSRKENYKKWLYEGLTYRAGDFLIGVLLVPLTSLFTYLLLHTNLDLTLEIGSTAAFSLVVFENAINTGWYYINRWLWSRTDKSE